MVTQKRTSGRRAPIWAILCTIFGALLMVGSGSALVAGEWLQARYEIEQRDLFGDLNPSEEYGADIRGPLNILLVGLDTRPSRQEEVPLADAIVIVHVSESLDSAYMISVPRDTLVDIPPFEPTGYLGGRDRVNAAMSYGSRPQPGETLPNVERGFGLLARTLGDLSGIPQFDAGAVVRFEGFEGIVDALGGITVTLDEEIYSCHRQPDGSHRALNLAGGTTCPYNYSGPQAYYPAGVNELEGWQALDIVRQRYGVTGGDYGRQRNQQAILKAIMDRAFSRDVVTNPVGLDRVVRAAGDALLFDGRGREPIDFAFALRDVRSGGVLSITLPATNLGTGGGYLGEQLEPEAYDLFAAMREGRIDEFIIAHPDLVN